MFENAYVKRAAAIEGNVKLNVANCFSLLKKRKTKNTFLIIMFYH